MKQVIRDLLATKATVVKEVTKAKTERSAKMDSRVITAPKETKEVKAPVVTTEEEEWMGQAEKKAYRVSLARKAKMAFLALPALLVPLVPLKCAEIAAKTLMMNATSATNSLVIKRLPPTSFQQQTMLRILMQLRRSPKNPRR